MEIIYETTIQNALALRVFLSEAAQRKNNLRIHYHSLIELTLVLEGKGIYKTNERSYPIQRGDICFYRPNEAHCITDIEEGGMRLLNIHVAPYYIYTYFPNALNSEYLKILAVNFPLKSHKLNDVLPPDEAKRIYEDMLTIRKEAEEKKSDFITYINNCLTNIFIKCSRAYKNDRAAKIKTSNYTKLLSVIEYIDNHFKEDITLDDLAKQVSYNRCYLSSAFKKCMGMSVWDYIGIKRIEAALTLIKTTNTSIWDIALACGFNNTANFNKIFKKYTNVTPAVFRK